MARAAGDRGNVGRSVSRAVTGSTFCLGGVADNLPVTIFAALLAAAVGAPLPPPLPLFPPTNWWNADVSAAPADANSAAYIAFIGGGRGMHPDFGGDSGDPSEPIYGMPYIITDGA